MFRITAKGIVFFAVGFVLGFVVNALVSLHDDSAVLTKECSDADQFYQLYKNCIKRMHEKCREGRDEGKENNVAAKTQPKEFLRVQQNSTDSEGKGQNREVVNPPYDPSIRYKLLSKELAPRKLLLVGVITAQKYLETRATGIYNTWGKEVSDIIFFSEQPNSTQQVEFSVVTLRGGVDDNMYPPKYKMFRMVQYLYDHYIDQFDFFMRVDDDMYMKTQEMHELLRSIDPNVDLYMGRPGTGRIEDLKRLKLEEHEHYCMGGPGVVFSQSLLRKFGPLIDECLETLAFTIEEDVELGRCISQMLNVQCTWSDQTKDLFFMDYTKDMATENLYKMESVKKAITLHALKDPIHMHRVHQYILELRAKRILQEIQNNTYDIQRVNEFIPAKLQHYHSELWIGHHSKFLSNNRFEVPIWYYFNSTHLFSDVQGKQTAPLPTDLKYSINSIALPALINHLNHFASEGEQYTPPYLLSDGFVVTDLSRGVEYAFQLIVHKKRKPYEILANVFIPLSSVSLVQVKPWVPYTTSVSIVVLVQFNKFTNHARFFSLFEKMCLQGSLQVLVHVLLTTYDGSNGIVSDINSLQSRYTHCNFTYQQTTQTARGSKLHDLIPPEDKQQLLIFLEPDYLWTESFIDHCLMNTVLHKQVYFPVMFTLFNEFQKITDIPPNLLVSPQTGYWNMHNYNVFCMYHSDYNNVEWLDDTSYGAEGVAFFEKIRKSHVRVIRALEPHLVQPLTQS